MTSNRRLSASEAHAWGLVSEVTEADQFAERAAQVAETYAALPTRGVGLTKRLFDHAYTASLEAQLELEAELQQEATGDRRLQRRRDGVSREAAAALQRLVGLGPPAGAAERRTDPTRRGAVRARGLHLAAAALAPLVVVDGEPAVRALPPSHAP